EIRGERQRHLTRGVGSFVAYAWLSMVEERVRLRRAACEHEDKEDDSNQRWASHGQLPRKGAGGLDRAAEQRLADAARVDVVEIEVQLRDDADIGSTLPVDRDQRLDTDLEGVTDPQHPGIDGAGGQRP